MGIFEEIARKALGKEGPINLERLDERKEQGKSIRLGISPYGWSETFLDGTKETRHWFVEVRLPGGYTVRHYHPDEENALADFSSDVSWAYPHGHPKRKARS